MSFDRYMLHGQANDASAKTFEFHCSACGQTHSGSPSFAYAYPPLFFSVPEHERQHRVRSSADTCIIDDEFFFVRTILEVPIIGAEEPFTWGVWVSQSRESFERYLSTYYQDQSGDRSFGWLTVTIPGYVDGSGASAWDSLPVMLNGATPPSGRSCAFTIAIINSLLIKSMASAGSVRSSSLV